MTVLKWFPLILCALQQVSQQAFKKTFLDIYGGGGGGLVAKLCLTLATP